MWSANRSIRRRERLVIYCQTTGVSAAHATHCATYCTSCRPLIRAFSGWIRTPPPTIRRTKRLEGQRIERESQPGLTPLATRIGLGTHPEVELMANLESISHRCYLFEMVFVWELTKETIHLPLDCLQGGHECDSPSLVAMAKRGKERILTGVTRP